jgi:C-terminal processing protease CtpA/Prc
MILALGAIAVAGVCQAQILGGGQNARQDRSQAQADRSNATQNNAAREGVQRTNANANGQVATPGRVRVDQNAQRPNSNARAMRRDDRAQRRTAMRPNDMRGPDIGLWFNRGNRDGLVISDVSNRGPIAKLGFRESDRIISVNGHRVTREPEFIEYLMASDADRVPVVVSRDGREETIYVQPSLLTEDYEYADENPLEQFGIVLDDRYNDRIVVWKVLPRTPAFYAGIREGDVITTFGDRPYHNRSEFEKALVGVKSGEANIQVRRGDKTRDLSVDVPDFERSDRSADRDNRSSERNERSADRNDRDRSADRNERSNDRNYQDRSGDRNEARSNDQNSDRSHANSEKSELRNSNRSDQLDNGRSDNQRNDKQRNDERTDKSNNNNQHSDNQRSDNQHNAGSNSNDHGANSGRGDSK